MDQEPMGYRFLIRATGALVLYIMTQSRLGQAQSTSVSINKGEHTTATI